MDGGKMGQRRVGDFFFLPESLCVFSLNNFFLKGETDREICVDVDTVMNHA